MNGSPSPTRVYGKLVLMALFWGGAFIGGRVATAEMAPAAAALWRFVVATIALLVAVHAIDGGLPRLSGKEWRGIALLAVTGVLAFNLFFMYGLARTHASRGALIQALSPAFTLLAAALVFREHLTRNKVLGVAVALLGVVVVLGRGDPLHLFSGGIGWGEIILFGCPVSWAIYTVAARRLLPGRSALAVTTYAAMAGTAMLAVVAFAATGSIAPPAASWQAWAAIAFTGVCGTALCFVWFYDGVRAIGPARTAVFINLVPVFAITLGVLLLGEPLEASTIVGAALVIAGVLLLNRPERAVPSRIVPAAVE